jgi:hypothetical protein
MSAFSHFGYNVAERPEMATSESPVAIDESCFGIQGMTGTQFASQLSEIGVAVIVSELGDKAAGIGTAGAACGVRINRWD